MAKTKLTAEQRFWAKVDRRGPDECWPWRAFHDKDGYGRFRLGERCRANRAAWIISYGPIPAGLCVLHRCDNPPCCNPAHLWLGTNADNMADRDAKGRQARGDRAGLRLHPERRAFGQRNGAYTHPEKRQRGEEINLSKLKTSDILEIRAALARNEPASAIAKRFGVLRQNIWMIKTGKIWSHV